MAVIIYSDINQYTPKQKPSLKNVEAVYQATYNLFQTDFKERLYRPEIGTRFEEELFQIEDDGFILITDANNSIRKFEPRLIPDIQKSYVETTEEHKFHLFIKAQVRGFSGTYEVKGEF